MENLSDVVLQVADEVTNREVSVAEEETAKAQLTRRIAWVLHQRNANLGLLRKTSGNQVNGRSTDTILDRTDGSSVDVATAVSLDGEARTRVRVDPLWFPYKANPDPAWLERWIEPTEAIRDEPGPLPVRDTPPAEEGGGEEPSGEEGGDETEADLFAQLLARDAVNHAELLAAIREVTQALQDIRRDIQNGATLLERLAAGGAISDIIGSVFSRRGE